jgi:two-component system chemotaxis response regulator CheY/two-component system response regulator (stage 0 sporulation protein A)
LPSLQSHICTGGGKSSSKNVLNEFGEAITAIVIDDDKDTVDVLCEFLQIKGIEIIGKGYDGKEAVDLYKKLKPDVVFLDVMMDGFDGFCALEKIREIQLDAIVVMVTADLTTTTEDRLSELNASAIVYKPYDINEIMQIVNKLTPIKVACLN